MNYLPMFRHFCEALSEELGEPIRQTMGRDDPVAMSVFKWDERKLMVLLGSNERGVYLEALELGEDFAWKQWVGAPVIEEGKVHASSLLGEL